MSPQKSKITKGVDIFKCEINVSEAEFIKSEIEIEKFINTKAPNLYARTMVYRVQKVGIIAKFLGLGIILIPIIPNLIQTYLNPSAGGNPKILQAAKNMRSQKLNVS